MTARAYQTRAAPVRELVVGPWRGVRDDLSPNASHTEYLAQASNCYLDNMGIGPSVLGRPGFAAMGAQLGSSGKRTSQRIYQFTKLNGTQYTVAIVGGQFYTYNWSTDTWTEVVTVANLTTNSITLSETAKVYCCTFADQLIVSDGVNVPWAWDGASGAGGLTKLTNCPVLFGQPVVYYAKLFGIKSTERSTIVWSEEGDPNEGYEALISGRQYNNAWTIGQTDQKPLHALAATNRALYLLRAQSVTEVLGAVADDFQTTGTREAISGSVGCQAPDGIEVVDDTVWFWGSDNRPYRIPAGGGLQEAGMGMVVASARLPMTAAVHASIVAVYLPYCRGVLFGVPESGQTAPTRYHLLSTETGEWIGAWSGWSCQTLDLVTDDVGLVRMAHGGGSTALLGNEGYLYAHGLPSLTVWNDGLVAGTGAITHSVSTGYLFFSPAGEHHLERVDVSVVALSDLSNCVLNVVSPDGSRSSPTFTITGSGGDLWDEFNWDEGEWAGDAAERTKAIGTASEGRWMRVTLLHGALGEEFQLNQFRLVGMVRDDRPGIQ